jgi:hypothetical protein
VSGSIDGGFCVATKGLEAINAGAKENTAEIVDLEEIPLAYLPSSAVPFRVEAVGDLD